MRYIFQFQVVYYWNLTRLSLLINVQIDVRMRSWHENGKVAKFILRLHLVGAAKALVWLALLFGDKQKQVSMSVVFDWKHQNEHLNSASIKLLLNMKVAAHATLQAATSASNDKTNITRCDNKCDCSNSICSSNAFALVRYDSIWRPRKQQKRWQAAMKQTRLKLKRINWIRGCRIGAFQFTPLGSMSATFLQALLNQIMEQTNTLLYHYQPIHFSNWTDI